ncbi:hypothetical protein DIPPA_70144 [Diplonema papillatum]|nr:hypothetical protein DIPPA_70144 [Diplonema papillatum]
MSARAVGFTDVTLQSMNTTDILLGDTTRTDDDTADGYLLLCEEEQSPATTENIPSVAVVDLGCTGFFASPEPKSILRTQGSSRQSPSGSVYDESYCQWRHQCAEALHKQTLQYLSLSWDPYKTAPESAWVSSITERRLLCRHDPGAQHEVQRDAAVSMSTAAVPVRTSPRTLHTGRCTLGSAELQTRDVEVRAVQQQVGPNQQRRPSPHGSYSLPTGLGTTCPAGPPNTSRSPTYGTVQKQLEEPAASQPPPRATRRIIIAGAASPTQCTRNVDETSEHESELEHHGTLQRLADLISILDNKLTLQEQDLLRLRHLRGNCLCGN